MRLKPLFFFLNSKTQICVEHQIRNSEHYVVWKVKKTFSDDMKLIYNTSPGIIIFTFLFIKNA